MMTLYYPITGLRFVRHKSWWITWVWGVCPSSLCLSSICSYRW